MPSPPGFRKQKDLNHLCRNHQVMAHALKCYRCKGHTDNHGNQNHHGVHNQVWGLRLLKLCTRTNICPFYVWCHRGVLEGDH
jgi:hypothetical protein